MKKYIDFSPNDVSTDTKLCFKRFAVLKNKSVQTVKALKFKKK